MDSGLQRPQSALARGVQITELSDGCMNPEPIVLQESDILMEQYLSPTKLQLLTGSDNLEKVETLELKVDTSETTLNNFGALLPNLRVLKLSGSVIPNIRDLGSSLRNLEVLWIPRCGLEELDGISSMLRLRELYLAYNEISDISALSMLEELEILDLEGNNVDDIGQIQYLSLCSKLAHLTMEGNPICVTPTVDAEEVNYDYRLAVKKVLVRLATLDDKALTEPDPSSSQNVFDADWAYLEELQKDAIFFENLDNEKETVSAAGRPTTAALKPATAYRPGSALRPSSGFRPSSSARRPASISGGRPSSAWTEGSKRRPASSDAAEGMESASELTCGVVICGNPSKALRARRKASDSQEDIDQSEEPRIENAPSMSPLKHEQQRVSLMPKDEEENNDDMAEGKPIEEKDLSHLMEELQSWKKEHEKRMEKIRESKAPQVFTIDHNNGGDLSGDSDASDTDDLDFRPDSAMDRYRSQQAQISYSSQRPSAMSLANYGHGDGEESFRSRFSPDGEGGFGMRFSPDKEGSFGSRSSPEEEQTDRHVRKPSRPNSHRLKVYEKSLDEDKHLLKEYERLKELSKQKEQSGEIEPPSREQGKLRELRVPSAGPRPPSPRRGVSPSPAPFPRSVLEVHSPGRETPYKDRPRKIKIGPTGLPGSSQSQQPQIRDILTPPGKPGLGSLVPPPGQRPPSSSGLQHRIRRTLPEVPPLPSRPPPISKS